MSRQNVKGEILVKLCNEIEWKIADFFLLPLTENYSFDSPSFSYLDGVSCFRCWPNIFLASGMLIALIRVHSSSCHNITFMFGIYVKEELKYLSQIQKSKFKQDGDLQGIFLDRGRRLLQKPKTWFSHGVGISIFCSILSWLFKDAVSQTMRTKGASEYTEENAVNFIKKDGEDDDTKLEFSTKLDVNSLVQNFRDLLSREEQCDILVKVKDKEFKAHKLILGARSSVFSSMFAYNTLEKKTNIVEITDCEPDAFMQFLIYLYTAQVEKVPVDQVTDLYFIANKYNVRGLKEECVNFMKDHITVETFCDVMSLALSHNEMALIESATNYFAENVRKLIITTKWITFVKKNPVESNELHIKILNYGNKKCSSCMRVTDLDN